MSAGKRPGFVLGTAQLGLPYGVANRTGMLSDADAVALLHAAAEAGLAAVDTARAYGESERRIGLAFDGRADVPAVVTKLDPLAGLPADDTEAAVAAARASVEASRAALRRERIDTLLLHRAAHRIAWGGAVWDLLRDLRRQGLVRTLGVSVQSPTELHGVLSDADIAHVQLPFNLLDRRWAASGALDALARRPDVTVHARSVFLQGLLAAPESARWPREAGDLRDTLPKLLASLAQDTGRADAAGLALAHVLAQDWCDGVVLGLESLAQLRSNLALMACGGLTAAQADWLARAIPEAPDALVDPSRWTFADESAPAPTQHGMTDDQRP